MANGHAHADDILSAAGGASPHYHAGAASGDDTTHKAGRQSIMHDRCGRHGNQCQSQRGDADGHQGFKAKFFSHYLISDEEQRHVLQEVDDAHQVETGRNRNVQHVDAEEAQQLRQSHKTPVVQSHRGDNHIDADGKEDVSSHHPGVLFDEMTVFRWNKVIRFHDPFPFPVTLQIQSLNMTIIHYLHEKNRVERIILATSQTIGYNNLLQYE